VTLKGKGCVPDILECKYLKNPLRDRGLVPNDHQEEMAYCKSTGHVVKLQDGHLEEGCTLSDSSSYYYYYYYYKF